MFYKNIFKNKLILSSAFMKVLIRPLKELNAFFTPSSGWFFYPFEIAVSISIQSGIFLLLKEVISKKFRRFWWEVVKGIILLVKSFSSCSNKTSVPYWWFWQPLEEPRHLHYKLYCIFSFVCNIFRAEMHKYLSE